MNDFSVTVIIATILLLFTSNQNVFGSFSLNDEFQDLVPFNPENVAIIQKHIDILLKAYKNGTNMTVTPEDKQGRRRRPGRVGGLPRPDYRKTHLYEYYKGIPVDSHIVVGDLSHKDWLQVELSVCTRAKLNCSHIENWTYPLVMRGRFIGGLPEALPPNPTIISDEAMGRIFEKHFRTDEYLQKDRDEGKIVRITNMPKGKIQRRPNGTIVIGFEASIESSEKGWGLGTTTRRMEFYDGDGILIEKSATL